MANFSIVSARLRALSPCSSRNIKLRLSEQGRERVVDFMSDVRDQCRRVGKLRFVIRNQRA